MASSVCARFDASRRGKRLLNSSYDVNEGAHRSMRNRGGGGIYYVTPDLSYEREGAGDVGQRLERG